MTLIVRGYAPADEAGVVRLWNDVLPHPAPHNHSESSLKKKLEVDSDLLLVATVDETIVGAIMGGYDGHRGWLYSVAVDECYREQGIGSALVRAMEEKLIDRGCLKINLQVRRSNLGVIAFYERLGFSVDDVVSLGKRTYEEGE